MKEIQATTYKTKRDNYVSVHFEISKQDITEKEFSLICENAIKYASLFHYVPFVFDDENNNYHIAFTIDTFCVSKISTGVKAVKYKESVFKATIRAINAIVCNSLQCWVNCKIIDDKK